MDMSNATAAGPSYGLLDILLGSKPKENDEADGQGFGGLMNLIKSLDKKMKDEDELILDGNRTEQEMTTGKSAADSRAVGIPGMINNMNLFQHAAPKQISREILSEKSVASLPMMSAQAPIVDGKIDASLVNHLLQEKAQPNLSSEEMNLLQEVNAKLDQIMSVSSGMSEVDASKKSSDIKVNLDSKVAAQPERIQEMLPEQKRAATKELLGNKNMQLEQNIAQTAVAPETFMNTETYLSMHENIKAKAKPLEQSEQKENAAENATNRLNANAEKIPLETEKKGKSDLFERASQESKQGSAGEKKALKEAGSFGEAINHSIKNGSELIKKDLYVNTAEPEQVRKALTGEVAQHVNSHAIKGGEMKLVVHPEELGEVKIKVGSKDGKVDVHITAKNDDVANIIRTGSKDLESSLGNQNLTLNKFEVSVSDSGLAVSSDAKSSLSEQFLSQQQNPNQHGLASGGGNSDSRSFDRWENQNQRNATADYFVDDKKQSTKMTQQMNPVPKYMARNSSQRLDVVA